MGIVSVEINIFVWRTLVGSLNALLSATVLGLFFYSYEQSYKALDDSNSTYVTQSQRAMPLIHDDIIELVVIQVALGLTLH